MLEWNLKTKLFNVQSRVGLFAKLRDGWKASETRLKEEKEN